MRPTKKQLENIIGRTLRDVDGQRVGSVGDIYLDEDTGTPEWLRVNISLLNNDVRFMPTKGLPVIVGEDDIHCPYEREVVHSAPDIALTGSLSVDDEKQLCDHYGLNYSLDASDSGLPVDAGGSR